MSVVRQLHSRDGPGVSAPAAAVMWHSLGRRDTLARLETSSDGLSETEAEARLQRYGPNKLDAAARDPAWRILVRQFRSVVVALLVAAIVLASIAGDPADATAIAVVLLLNVSIGFVTEIRARRAVEALRRLDVPHATVIREGVTREIDATALVPGDVIRLESGRAVPADARLLASVELRTVEAPLTGESLPVAKVADVTLPADAPLVARSTMIYKGTTVAAGNATAVVIGTGSSTEVGRIGALVAGITEEQTPLEKRLDSLGRQLAIGAIGIAILVSALDLSQGMALGEVLLIGIAIAVAAVPEGLPAVSTITMAIGVRRMARRHAIIRRMPIVESLGSATVVCTDKTGTLTLGDMTATTYWTAEGLRWPAEGTEVTVTGSGYAPVGNFQIGERAIRTEDFPALRRALVAGCLANRATLALGSDGRWHAQGDPTEAALLVTARKAGMDRDELLRQWPETKELPFSSERMFMATFHQPSSGNGLACVKGAPARVVARCASVAASTGDQPLDETTRNALLASNYALASRGLRVLALADGATEQNEDEILHRLTFVGLVGMADPPAPGVKETIDQLRGAGIRTIMITGDQRITAASISRSLGISLADDETLDGREIDAMSDDMLTQRVATASAFSRVSPEAKLRIVTAFRRRGEVVAMLGDGVNDAPALARADVGVAMGGRGTDVAKEAAGVVLADDRFSTIAVAVEEGRVIYANIRRFVFYLLSCNLAEIMLLLVAGVVGLPSPLRPLQILWLNLLTDTLPALALAFEPADPAVMTQPPRDPESPLLSRRLLVASAGYAVLIAACALAALLWGLFGSDGSGAPDVARRAITLTFMTIALTQLAHLANARYLPGERGGRPTNWYAFAALALTISLQLAAIYVPPLAAALGVVPLGARDLLVILSLALVPLWAGYVVRLTAQMSRRHA